jgi:hypothetical protein
MEKSHRNILIVLLALLAAVFAFNRWAFRETAPTPVKVFLGPIAESEENANDVFRLLEMDWEDYYPSMLIESAAYAPNTNRRDRILRILEGGTGESFGDDRTQWQRWLWSKEPNLHPEFSEFKALLYEPFDPSFREYFHKQRVSTIRLDEVLFSRMRRDGMIPPLTQPKHITAPRSDALSDEELVVGIEINGKPRAYPKRMLEYHEVVLDELGGESVMGTFCGFSGMIAFYESTINGVTYKFGTSGFIYRSNKLLYDHATKSLWQSLSGLPVIGPMAGGSTRLKPLPVVITPWKTWLDAHPDTTLLSPETGFGKYYSQPTVFENYGKVEELAFPVPKLDSRLAVKAEVLAIRAIDPNTQQLAIAREFLQSKAVHHGESGGQQYLVVTDPGGASRVYESGATQFESFDGKTAIDTNKGTWKMTESALVGPDGTKLRRYPAHRVYWHSWSAAFPDTQLVK